MEKKQREIEHHEELDLTGLICPVPIALTSEKVKRLEEGQILKVRATDPGYERDIWNWIKQSGNELLALEKDGNTVIAYIRKKKDSREPSLWYWIKFHSLGIKLHTRLFLTMLKSPSKRPDHFITFLAISEGVRAEKFLKERMIDINATLLPIPNEIDPHCGVVLAVKGYRNAIRLYTILKSQNIGVEKIYKKDKKSYREVEYEG